MRRILAASALALLWLGCGWVPFILGQQGGSAATVARLIPSPMRGGFFTAPLPWALALQALAVIAVACVFATVSSWFMRDRASFAVGWLCAILTGFAIGAALDAGAVVAQVGVLGVRGALGSTGATALAVMWAFLVGWIPALILRGRRAEAATGRLRIIAVTAIAVLSLAALPLLDHGAHAATQRQLIHDQAAARAAAAQLADPDGAAARDPQAAGSGVPTVAPAAPVSSADACTPENSTVLAPAADAATGHRLQVIEVFNSGERACTVSGYPDVAFGDQNSHLLPVEIAHGSSFMAADQGPRRITVEPGETVSAELGWDAQSVHGQLAARTLWAASSAGVTRLSWPVTLDVIPGTTVHVTAWHAREGHE